MLYIFTVLLLFGQSLPVPMSNSPVCDDSRAIFIQEGNIGESENFPWLGILRVHLHEFNQLKIAVTGLVLVKDSFAIANADDIHRIPKHVFMQDSKAMFIPKQGQPWFTKPKDYMIHPEFEYSTYNTIALVELELQEGETQLPFKPVCWPGNFFNTSNQLYALGYTDDNKLMEKTMYSIQYVKPSLCKEFYNRAGFTEPKSEPLYVQCGFAENNKNDCAWENGMALVSNSSGKWTLIGLGLRGPGCAAPARFLDMSVYLPWVESATDLEEINDYPDLRRKTAFNVGFRRRDGDAKKEDRIAFREQYPGLSQNIGDFNIYELERGPVPFWEMPINLEEAGFLSGDRCTIAKVLVYREQIHLVDAFETGGSLEYRVTMYDKHIYNYTCIKVQIKNVKSRYPVRVGSHVGLDFFEGTGFEGPIGDTPLDLLKHYPLPSKFEPPSTTSKQSKDSTEPTPWKPGEHLEAKYVVDTAEHPGNNNIVIILGFVFKGNATMDFYVYGLPRPQYVTKTSTESTGESTAKPLDLRKKYPRERKRQRHPRERETDRDFHKFPRIKRKNRLEKARQRAAERKAQKRAMRA